MEGVANALEGLDKVLSDRGYSECKGLCIEDNVTSNLLPTYTINLQRHAK